MGLLISVMGYAKSPGVPEYQIVGDGQTLSGVAMVKVSVVAKKADKVTQQMLINAAVHGVLFKGYAQSPTESNYVESASFPPLAGAEAEVQHADFFNDFFAGGNAESYAQFVDDTRRVVKVGKEYKVTQTVAVRASDLKKILSKQGIIKTLGAGW